MNIEERVNRVMAGYRKSMSEPGSPTEGLQRLIRWAMEDAYEAGVKAEREACAKTAESFLVGGRLAAVAIRQRGTP